jgi:hypothetical protein
MDPSDGEMHVTYQTSYPPFHGIACTKNFSEMLVSHTAAQIQSLLVHAKEQVRGVTFVGDWKSSYDPFLLPQTLLILGEVFIVGFGTRGLTKIELYPHQRESGTPLRRLWGFSSG